MEDLEYRFPKQWAGPLSLCEYHAPFFTEAEMEAVREFHAAYPLALAYNEPPDLDADDPAAALREHAAFLGRWHTDLSALLLDPRLARPHDPQGPGAQPRYTEAVTRLLTMLGGNYHLQRQYFEDCTTRWALGLREEGAYPPLTRRVDLVGRTLTALD
ncbi:hypothetical protein [Streptomyces sp. NRRL S-350]|uniref:hypothetical protein n=1 Tax=Streptomyces sp. NRRL S-350 TaxID=1463902 RepID=UPI0004C24412|nr:hypothetical protein [Streptomyces sp. NRRL S-350]